MNRKSTDDGEKINWFTIRRIVNNASDPFVLELEIDGDKNSKRINISKKGITIEEFIFSEVHQLPNRIITKKKYDDLKSLLKFIPSEYHKFYTQLKYKNDDDEEDFGLASGDSDEENDETYIYYSLDAVVSHLIGCARGKISDGL